MTSPGSDKAWGHSLADIHEAIGTIGYYLIGLHAAAALHHHYFMHDNTLLRMLPWRTAAEPAPPLARKSPVV